MRCVPSPGRDDAEIDRANRVRIPPDRLWLAPAPVRRPSAASEPNLGARLGSWVSWKETGIQSRTWDIESPLRGPRAVSASAPGRSRHAELGGGSSFSDCSRAVANRSACIHIRPARDRLISVSRMQQTTRMRWVMIFPFMASNQSRRATAAGSPNRSRTRCRAVAASAPRRSSRRYAQARWSASSSTMSLCRLSGSSSRGAGRSPDQPSRESIRCSIRIDG